MTLLVLLLACEPDRFGRLSEAVSAFEQGKAQLAAGEDAVESMREAAERDPRSPELRMWLGRALAARGQLPEAIAAATEALALRPGWPLAHYNRACWALRSGDAGLVGAARADLAIALASGTIHPMDAAEDPDLAPFRGDPRFADLLPPPILPAAAVAPEGPVFWGSDWVLELTTSVRTGQALRFAGEVTLPPQLRPQKALELVEPDGLAERRTLRLTFVVAGAGEGELGPFSLEAGPLRADLPPVRYQLLAPPDRAAPAPVPGPTPLLWPSTLLTAAAEPSVGRQGEDLLVRFSPGDQLIWSQEPSAKLDLELRQQGRTLALGQLARPVPGAAFEVQRAGKAILRGGPY